MRLPSFCNLKEKKIITHSAVCLMITLILFIIFLGIPSSVHAGLGVSPGTLIIEDIRPGTKLIKDITFSRGDASRFQRLAIKITGPAAEFLSGAAALDMPVGQNNVSYSLTINTGSLAAGTYEATLTGTESMTPETDGDIGEGYAAAQAFITTGARAIIRFTVTNNSIQEFSIKEIVMQASEEMQPLGFSYFIINSGNVDARPSKIEIAITDQTDPENIYKETILGETLAPVAAFSEKNVNLLTQAKLNIGRYWVDFTFYDGDKIIFTRTGYALQIFPPGTLAQKGKLREFTADKNKYRSNELIIFSAVFKNEGTIGISASFVIDLLRGDRRVDILKTEVVFIPPGKTADFSINHRLSDGGSYLAKGRVNFGIYNSDEIEARFVVERIKAITLVGAIIILIIILAVFIWRFYQWRYKSKNKKFHKIIFLGKRRRKK